MEKKFNPLDLTQVSKKQLDKSKRIEEQAAEFLKLHDKKLIEEAALLEKKKHEALASGAMFSKNSAYVKNKNRAKAVQEAIGYADRASKAAMTDIVSTIVENALLLDTAEFEKLNPGFRSQIREQVSELLEKGNIEKFIKNKKTLKLMEHVAKSIPDVKTGVYLKEEELIDIVRKSTPAEINNVISSLTGDVKQRVANLVVKEQDDAAEIQKEVDELVNAKETVKAENQEGEIPAEVAGALQSAGISLDQNGQPVGPDGQPLPPEAVQQMISQAAPQPEMAQPEEGPSQEELLAMQQAPGITNPAPQFDEYGQEIEPEQIAPAAAVAGVPQTANKNTAVEISPDGTVRVNIVRERFFREHPRQGILESLALNEALDMVKSGKPYNGELALANAILHLTVLEAFNASGLMPISDIDYSRMLNLPFRKKSLKEEGEAAAQPVATSDAPAKEHTPEADNKDILKGQHAEEVKEVIVEAKKSWKDKVKAALAEQEANKPWNKKIAEEKAKSK